MNKAAGSRIGAYEIVALLGAGGMGEVYRARDTKLGREVALKLLPEIYTVDRGRRARFEREAQILAALNHPHIAAIYGFEDSGTPAPPTSCSSTDSGPVHTSLRVGSVDFARDQEDLKQETKRSGELNVHFS
jgi:serine/threonine protein kinase